MNFETYDSNESESDEDYFAFVRHLEAVTASELREAKSSLEKVKTALCRYYKRGYRANLTPGELIDFLGVSSPSIFDMAGYTDAESEAAVEISDRLSREEIDQTQL